MSQLLFTPAAVLDLLMSIDELQGTPIELEDNVSSIKLRIGGSEYNISDNNASEIKTDSRTLSDVEAVAEDAYDELEQSGKVEYSEPVQSGLLKNVVKSLLLGGMLRLSAKLLK